MIYDTNTFSPSTWSQLETAAKTYRLKPEVIVNGVKENLTDEDKLNLAVNNTCNLLSNVTVQELLLKSKEQVFSRKDSQNPEERFGQAIRHIAKEVAGYFAAPEPFDHIFPYENMRITLQTYNKSRSEATFYSNRIKDKLIKALKPFKRELENTEMVFHLLGSVRYGDAARNSDIDANLIAIAEEDSLTAARGELRTKIDQSIDTHLGTRNQNRDGMNLIYLAEYQAILIDILNGDTTQAGDYAYKNDLFHPYDWLLQGINPLQTKGTVDHEINETQTMIDKAAKADPFFQFLLCYKMMPSLLKRDENLQRFIFFSV